MSQEPYSSPDGYHRHDCPACDCIWEHEDAHIAPRRNAKDAHKCPKCGAEAKPSQIMAGGWKKYYGDRPPDVRVASSLHGDEEFKELVDFLTKAIAQDHTVIRKGELIDGGENAPG